MFDEENGTCIACPNNTVVDKTVAVTTKLEDCVCMTGFVPMNDTFGNCVGSYLHKDILKRL